TISRGFGASCLALGRSSWPTPPSPTPRVTLSTFRLVRISLCSAFRLVRIPPCTHQTYRRRRGTPSEGPSCVGPLRRPPCGQHELQELRDMMLFSCGGECTHTRHPLIIARCPSQHFFSSILLDLCFSLTSPSITSRARFCELGVTAFTAGLLTYVCCYLCPIGSDADCIAFP
ncbi:hypothetical protein B0H11DRAFT_2044117, partial [Mycena galericulata]